MDTFYEFVKQIREEMNSMPAQDAGTDPTDANTMKYSNKSAGALGAKEDFFLSQLQQKASALGPQQRFKILGDVVMTLYPDPGERAQYIQLLKTQNMQQSVGAGTQQQNAQPAATNTAPPNTAPPQPDTAPAGP